MDLIVNDGTLVRGSTDETILGNVYAFLDFKDDFGKARSEKDYDARGKPKAQSHAEDFRQLTGTIRMRSDQPAPPRWTSFAYSGAGGATFYISDIELSGSTTGLKAYTVTIQEQKAAALVIS